MGLLSRYCVYKREVYYKSSISSYVEVFSGLGMYKLARGSKIEYIVDCLSPVKFSIDVLITDGCKGKFFYFDPEDTRRIRLCDGYDDLWYKLNVPKVKSRSLVLADKCLEVLDKYGISRSSLCVLMLLPDGLYHLMVDGKDYGYLADDNEDLEFKELLRVVSKDCGKADVIVFPSNGDSFLFREVLGVYRSIDDFLSACSSKRVVMSLEETFIY